MKNIFPLLLLASFLFSGCVRTFLPGYFFSSPAPLIIENRDDYGKEKTYAGLDLQNPIVDYDNESIFYIRGKYSSSRSGKYGSINVGLYAYAGLYKIYYYEYENGSYYKNKYFNETFFGVGPVVDAALMFPIDRFKIGVGVNSSVNLEGGSYYKFRRNQDQGSVFNFYASLFPVISWEFENNYILSAQCNVGFPGLISPMLALNTINAQFWIGWKPTSWSKYDYYWGSRVLGHFSLGYSFKI